jgi:hypothetical protein
MKNKISMTKMPISMTSNRIFQDLQDFQVWNQQVQISKTFQIFKAPYEPEFFKEKNSENAYSPSRKVEPEN